MRGAQRPASSSTQTARLALLHQPAEGDLVVVDHLAEAGQPGHDDGDAPGLEGVDDRAGSGVAHDDVGAATVSPQLVDADVGLALGVVGAGAGPCWMKQGTSGWSAAQRSTHSTSRAERVVVGPQEDDDAGARASVSSWTGAVDGAVTAAVPPRSTPL